MEKRPNETDLELSSGYASRSGRRPPAPETIRNDGLRKIRRVSNWSLAALVVGMGATTGALAAATQSKTIGTSAVTSTAGATTSATTGTCSEWTHPGKPCRDHERLWRDGWGSSATGCGAERRELRTGHCHGIG